ncbi:MAG: SPOR domain-containing protein [Gammaproteobacteria bacterium]
MPRDYKTRVTSKNKKSLPGYIWLLSGLAIGLFVAFIVYLDKQPENNKDFGSAVQLELEKLKQQAKKKNSAAASTSKTSVSEKKEPKFNFYTLLPELEVFIPESETRPPVRTSSTTSTVSSAAKSKSSNTQHKSKKQYILQVGSFQNLNDAKKLKANLAFLGLEAGIQHVTVNKQAWHRVRTGPYQNKQQLYKKQKLLKQNEINSISMELK